ncbi:peptidase S41-like protein [Leeuwenhoekiella aestuarii]|uniref:Peptidase S41-like protein n=2 Tax=Leeuwenhoekiella aestuarii TaxID=2249426 RepID=A0A4Q0NZK8_9FLAO|nr:peptidase S41-like protein [Leeuwenhoekiella aestuarii]RXG19710.1 peptidase S41-like protein [Leeuwenhoekiella aestuarii]
MFPKDWFAWGDYTLTADTTTVHSGKFSGKIKATKAGSFGSIGYRIPANYEGTSIQLEGYMKLKNVANGFGGLLIRIDDDQKSIAFDNMESQHIKDTKDWQHYSITLPYPREAENIFIGGILTGTGEAWFDDFVLTIDGKDVQTLAEKEKPVFKATLDNEFELGSKIDVPKLDEALISNLELLGTVWGFLKYNHPEVCKGNYNWDFELFRMLPNYLKTTNKIERDQILLQWISKYGELDKCTECKKTSPEAFIKPDLSWLNADDLNPELKNKIEYIYQNRCQGKHFYIKKGGAGNPDFSNENIYYSLPSDDDGFQLLALYRYWNMVHYFFPSKYLTDNDWNGVLKEYIPKFINAKNKFEYELASIELIGEINDTHASTSVGFSNVQYKRGNLYPPILTQFIDEQLVVTDYYKPELKGASQVETGDVITHIEGKSINTILDSIRPYYPASNDAAKRRNIAYDILRSNKEQIRIDYISNNQKKAALLPLYEKSALNMRWYKWTDEPCYKLLDGNIGYITLAFIKEEDIALIKETFKNTKGIIIDIRNYPSTFVPFTLGSYFVSSTTPFVKFTKFNLDNPGEFNFTAPLEIPKDAETYRGKLVVLVNEDTQSQAEYTAMAFRAGANTTIVGSTTAGADGNVSSIYLPGGLLTNISGNGVYYPDGTQTQRVGIIPDVEVTPTIEGLKKGRDEVLEKAIEVINE